MNHLLKVGIIGDYNPNFRPHRVTIETLDAAADSLGLRCEVSWIPTPELESEAGSSRLASFDAVWCSPGSPYRSLEGALEGVRFARERGQPFLGTCAGFQHAVLEFARNVLGYREAMSAEYDASAATLVITPILCSIAGRAMPVRIRPGTLAHRVFGRSEITEFYYCGFGLNPAFQDRIHRAGLNVAGSDEQGEARIVELPEHPFFMATLFVPGDPAGKHERRARGEDAHPLVVAYLRAARERAFSRLAPDTVVKPVGEHETNGAKSVPPADRRASTNTA